MDAGGYISADVVHLRGGYQEAIVVTVPIHDHINGHYVKPNWVAFKYLDF